MAIIGKIRQASHQTLNRLQRAYQTAKPVLQKVKPYVVPVLLTACGFPVMMATIAKEEDKEKASKLIKKQLELTVLNEDGIHARPALSCTELKEKFKSAVYFEDTSGERVPCAMLPILSLGAGQGSKIKVIAEGEDAEECVRAFAQLFECKFNKDEFEELEKAKKKIHKRLEKIEAADIAETTDEKKMGGISVSYGYNVGAPYYYRRFSLNDFQPAAIEDTALIKQKIMEASRAFDRVSEKVQAELDQNAQRPGSMQDIFISMLRIIPEMREEVLDTMEKLKLNLRGAFESFFKSTEAAFKKGAENAELTKYFNVLNEIAIDTLVEKQGIRVDLNPAGKTILIANSISSSEIARLVRQGIDGIALEEGGKRAHESIIAENLGIPMVVAIKGLLSSNQVNRVAIDAVKGEVYLNPGRGTVRRLAKDEKKFVDVLQELIPLRLKAIRTRDKVKIELGGNVDFLSEAKRVNERRMDAIGLVRSEYFFMLDADDIERNQEPSVEEQFAYYKALVKAADKKPVTIRTIDIKPGDKELPYFFKEKQMPLPSLNREGLELCLDRHKHDPYYRLFKRQLRAILKASAFGNIRILFPMVNDARMFKAAKELVKETMRELDRATIKVAEFEKFKDKKIDIWNALIESDYIDAKGNLQPEFDGKLENFSLDSVLLNEQDRLQVFSALQKAAKRRVPYNREIEIGAMIETQAAVRNAEEIIKLADFISIGTNDLVQDFTGKKRHRDSASSTDMFHELHPLVINALEKVTRLAEAAIKPISVCGDMASDPLYLLVLMGLGIKSFSISMDPDVARKIIRSVAVSEIKENLFKGIAKISTPEERGNYMVGTVRHLINEGPWAELESLKELYFRAL